VVDTQGRPRSRNVVTSPASARGASASKGQGMVLVALNVSWALVMARFGRGDIYWMVGLHALLVMAVVVAVRGASLRQASFPRRRDLVLGVVVGVIMTVATYGAFEVARTLVPSLSTHVTRLYRAAGTEAPAVALAWTLVILTAEELLWRGAWIDTWTPRVGATAAAVSSVLAFAVTQLGSGSVIVAVLACTCGAIWTALRMHTGRVAPSLIAHAIWTPIVIVLFPVV
jgi:membrane protease YdiL (CAAX protease family)